MTDLIARVRLLQTITLTGIVLQLLPTRPKPRRDPGRRDGIRVFLNQDGSQRLWPRHL